MRFFSLSHSPLPKQMLDAANAIDIGDYKRIDWWAKKKANYAAEVAQHEGNGQPQNGDDSPAYDDDDVPF